LDPKIIIAGLVIFLLLFFGKALTLSMPYVFGAVAAFIILRYFLHLI
jgi:hypothetical protein